MPLVRVTLVDDVFTSEEKHEPRSLMTVLERSKAMAEAIDGRPTSRAEFARAAPVVHAPDGPSS